MSSDTPEQDVPVTRLDRILAVTSLTIIVIAVVCFFAIIIGSVTGADFSTPVWTIVSAIPYFGLPLGVLLFFVLLISNYVRRSRLAKAARTAPRS